MGDSRASRRATPGLRLKRASDLVKPGEAWRLLDVVLLERVDPEGGVAERLCGVAREVAATGQRLPDRFDTPLPRADARIGRSRVLAKEQDAVRLQSSVSSRQDAG